MNGSLFRPLDAGHGHQPADPRERQRKGARYSGRSARLAQQDLRLDQVRSRDRFAKDVPIRLLGDPVNSGRLQRLLSLRRLLQADFKFQQLETINQT